MWDRADLWEMLWRRWHLSRLILVRVLRITSTRKLGLSLVSPSRSSDTTLHARVLVCYR